MKTIILALMVFSFSNAFAADAAGEGSEYMHQAADGKWEATAGLTYSKNTFKLKPGTTGGRTKQEGSGHAATVRGEYGITDMFSAGLILSMGSQTTKTSPAGLTRDVKSSGLEDPVAFFHGRAGMGGGWLRYGADLNFALSKSKTKSNGDTNNSSGGIGMAPFVGFEMSKDTCTIGAKLSYQMNLGDSKDTDESATPTTESTVKGGETTTLALFYEHGFSPTFLLGVAIGGEGSAATKSTPSGGATSKDAGTSSAFLNVYAAHKINDMITVLPTVTYYKVVAMDTSTIDSASLMDLGVSGRFTF